VHIYIQPNADRVAKNHEIILRNFHYSSRRTSILMGWITSTMSLPGTNCKSHGQNSGAPAKFQTESQDSVPIYLHLAVSKENYNRMTHLSHRKLD